MALPLTTLQKLWKKLEGQAVGSVEGGIVDTTASALVAGAATAIQSYSQNMLGERLGPEEMRTLLERTGLPQQGAEEDGAIGPFLQMRAAIEELRQRREGGR